MSLTNDDLQAIKDLLKQELKREIKRELQPINDRLDRMEADISSLKAGQTELKKDTKEIKRKVSVTYDIALDAWGAGKENRHWPESLPT